jgi:hypothetical protein
MSSDSMKLLIEELNENMPQTQINETLIKTLKELINKPKK